MLSNKIQGENMKSLIIAFSLVILSLDAFSGGCDKLINDKLINGRNEYTNWGSKVDVAHSAQINFYYETTESVQNFDVFFQNRAGFECSLVSIDRFNRTCAVISIDWSPGADSSGCTAYLVNTKTKNVSEVTSDLYMNY